MNKRRINLDEELTDIERHFLRNVCHEQVKCWLCEGYAYPISLLLSFCGLIEIMDGLLQI